MLIGEGYEAWCSSESCDLIGEFDSWDELRSSQEGENGTKLTSSGSFETNQPSAMNRVKSTDSSNGLNLYLGFSFSFLPGCKIILLSIGIQHLKPKLDFIVILRR